MRSGKMVLLGALLATSTAMADDAFEFHGYARTGTNTGILEGFQTSSSNIPPKQQVGRLGNEPDHYWETQLSKKITFKNDIWSNYVFMLAQGSESNNDWVDPSIGFRQAYVEGGGFPNNSDLIFWAGKRFYNRADIHITDFYYRDYSGTGAGVQNLGGFMDIGYIVRDGNEVTDASGFAGNDRMTVMHNIHAKMKFAEEKLKINILGQVQPNAKQVSEMTAAGGFQVDAEVSFEPVTLALQYGYGLGASLGNMYGTGKSESDMALRFVAHSNLNNEGSSFALQSQAWIQYDINETAEGDDVDRNTLTISAVARPILRFNDVFSLQSEAGLGYVGMSDEANKEALGVADRDQVNFKLTVAPTLNFDMGIWARPQLRAFVTYNGWNQGVDDRQIKYTEEKGNVVCGVQAEIWF